MVGIKQKQKMKKNLPENAPLSSDAEQLEAEQPVGQSSDRENGAKEEVRKKKKKKEKKKIQEEVEVEGDGEEVERETGGDADEKEKKSKKMKNKKEKRRRDADDDSEKIREEGHAEDDEEEEEETEQPPAPQQIVKKSSNSGGLGIMTTESFFSLPLSEPTKNAIKEIGFVNMTQTTHLFAYLVWSCLQFLLTIWHQAVDIFNKLESHSISFGLLKKYSAIDVNKLKYLAIVVESEDACEISKIIELLQWLADIGLKHVCLYDMEGVLKKFKEVIMEKCNTKSIPWQVVDASKALDNPDQRTLEFASFSDGKEGVVKAANLLSVKCLKSREQGIDQELPKFTEKLMDDALATIGCRGPDPDLLLVYGPARCHLGFPAWRMRYTEIVHMGPLRSASYGLLLKAIYKFTTVRQNYGK